MAKFTAIVHVDLEIVPPAGGLEEQREWVRSQVEHGLAQLDTARRLEQQLEAALFGAGTAGTVGASVYAVMVDDVDHPADFTGGSALPGARPVA